MKAEAGTTYGYVFQAAAYGGAPSTGWSSSGAAAGASWGATPFPWACSAIRPRWKHSQCEARTRRGPGRGTAAAVVDQIGPPILVRPRSPAYARMSKATVETFGKVLQGDVGGAQATARLKDELSRMIGPHR